MTPAMDEARSTHEAGIAAGQPWVGNAASATGGSIGRVEAGLVEAGLRQSLLARIATVATDETSWPTMPTMFCTSSSLNSGSRFFGTITVVPGGTATLEPRHTAFLTGCASDRESTRLNSSH